MNRLRAFPHLFLLTPLLIAAGAVYSADMRDITTMALVRDMGLGINLGNTFESACDWDDNNCWIGSSGGVNAYETAWGSPTVTKAMIDGYAAAGFKTVRIPVAWSNLMTGKEPGGTYAISPALLNRVEEAVNWVLANNMYAIVNIHWDGGWWKNFPTDSTECMSRYIKMWTQISGKFKDYSDYLVFESLNEEGVWDDVWYIWRNGDDMAAKARAYGILNAINQTFTDLIRASGGNNAERHLLIAGYATNIDRTIDGMFRMPDDPLNRQAVSVHYYDPFGFTHSPLDNSWSSWAPLRLEWGNEQDISQLNAEMDKLKAAFVNNGIPVIIGEYGVAEHGRPENEIRKYTLAVAEAAYGRGICPVLWDVQLADNETQYYYNRKANPPSFADPLLVSGFKAIVPDGAAAVKGKLTAAKRSTSRPAVTISGRTLNVNAGTGVNSKVRIRLVNMTGKTVANFNADGNARLPLKKIPAGAYIVEAKRAADGYKTTLPVVLR